MTGQNRKCKICIVTTIDLSLDKLFPDFYPLLLAEGFEVVGICADGPYLENVRRQGVQVIPVPMSRSFTPIQDLKCIWLLYRIFRAKRFDIVHYSTPKAAFLSAVACRLARCPACVYTLRGLGYTAFSGLKRFAGKFCEMIACRRADYVIAISNSLKEEVVKCGLLQAERIKVIGAGSSKGVNLEQFRPCEKTKTDAAKIRRDLGINDNEVVIGYVGRLTEEKGITELLTAFCNIRKTNNAVHILLVGDQDQRAPLPAKAIELMAKTNSVHMVSFNDNIIPFIAAMDVLVLASYREGFGNVLIEASAMEKPVIGTDIIGCRDAVVDGTTGILVKPHNPVSLEKALITLIENPAKRTEMGRNGRQWVKENFDRNLIWDGLIKVYQQTLRRVKKK